MGARGKEKKSMLEFVANGGEGIAKGGKEDLLGKKSFEALPNDVKKDLISRRSNRGLQRRGA